VGLGGLAMLLSMRFFDTSYAWFDASYLYGTNHWEVMVMGMTSNLPGILQKRYGWESALEVLFTIDLPVWVSSTPVEVTVKRLMLAIYLVLTVLTTIGIAAHDRRRDTRFLVAICTPWLLFFTIPCQIHERYLLFAACVATVGVGHRIGFGLMSLFLSAVTWVMTMHVMIGKHWLLDRWSAHLAREYPQWFEIGTRFPHDLYAFIRGTHPDIGWAIILATLLLLWVSVTPVWVRRARLRAAETERVLEGGTASASLPDRSRPVLPAQVVPQG
jgi:hypothetical protein